jgi:hypothetical protein
MLRIVLKINIILTLVMFEYFNYFSENFNPEHENNTI